MGKYKITDARVYLSTMKRYACQNHFGKWVELAAFNSKKDFVLHCMNLFPDEKEPVIIYMDWQYIPLCLIRQDEISAKVFSFIRRLRMLEETQQLGFTVWLEKQKHKILLLDTAQIIELFMFQYVGYFGNRQQFAEYYAKQSMGITKTGSPRFDFISYTNQLFKDQFMLESGFVFKKNGTLQ